MKLRPEEPAAGPWRVASIAEVASALLGQAGPLDGRPAVVAVDGRSSSGKTTLARRIVDAVSGAWVVHTDDFAWRHAVFDWVNLLAGGVLEPVRQGLAVSFRPPAWDAHNRPGAIRIPAGAAMVVVEGVGAARRELTHLLDATVWVQSDLACTQRRDAARLQTGEMTQAEFNAWMAEEVPFLAEQRPWERASVIVAGTPVRPHDPRTQFVIADALPDPPGDLSQPLRRRCT